ncbi:MAG TPA: glycosyltransferase family 4 protein [Polyangia bacterium]|nr:glycosyltransferase family 4 protein [Polyangia bacterium]
MTKIMRIAFVLLGDLDLVSGGFLYDRMLVERLRRRGHTVDVVSLPWGSRARAVASNLQALPPALADADVVIEDELCHAAVFARNRQLRRAGVPVVALVHNLAHPARGGHRPPGAALERRYLRTVDAIVAVCESTLRDARASLERDVPAIVAPAGRDHLPASLPTAAAVAARARAAGPLRVLSSAAVTRGKGLHRLLDVLARPAAAAVELDVAGPLDVDPVYVRRVQTLIERLGLAARVRLHGLLRDDALWALYARAHVLALPSDREAYPLAVVEALGFGLPVLVTDEGGAREVLGEGAQGRCLAPGDTDAWATALAAFAADRDGLARAGAAALDRFAALGTWDDVAARVEALCARAAVLND